MEARWLAVFAALALCVSARPEAAGNDIQQASQTTNEIASKEMVHAKPENVKTEPKVIEAKPEAEAPSADTQEVVVTAGADAGSSSNATLKSVNERFPHAVLFGGACGGSILSPKWILTAGHCTLFTSGRSVLAGTDNSWDGSGVSRRVKRLVIHPLFSVGPYWLDAHKYDIKQVAAHWDFMLVELEEPLPLDGTTIAAVELHDQTTIPEGLEVGYGGYGAENHGETMRGEMHGMELQVLADTRCQQALEQYDAKDMVCTQGRPPMMDSACNGDSGSGLVNNGKLYGVTSWVQDDSHRCFNGALVIFSRVGAARDWIRQVTKI